MRASSQEEARSFVAARRAALYRSAYLLVGNAPDADDLVQATLVRVIAAWERIHRQDAPELFARRVMVNLAASRWRRLKTYAGLEHRVDPVPDEPDVADGVVTRDAVWTAIQGLPVRMRAVVVLRYYEDLSEREIAAVLGCSTGTVKSQSSKALARLRAQLEPAEHASADNGPTAIPSTSRSRS